MKDTLRVVNEMRDAGAIGKYAIGGAVGASFYVEALSTADIDIFVGLSVSSGSLLASLEPVYDYLVRERGYAKDGEHIVVEGWNVQFLPLGTALVEEAVASAVETDVDGLRTWVMTAEHLASIALQTGRLKDYARIEKLFEDGALDEAKLRPIISRHGMLEKWESFADRYLRKSEP